MPWLSGPPLCGQRSSSAKTWSSAVRNTRDAALRRPHHARAAARNLIERADIGPDRIGHGVHSAARGEVGDRREFVRVLAGDALGPGIGLGEGLRDHEAVVERAALLDVVDDLRLDRGRADALRPFVDALEIAPLLAVELDEGGDDFDRLLFASRRGRAPRCP